jgi:hypothetical protein
MMNDRAGAEQHKRPRSGDDARWSAGRTGRMMAILSNAGRSGATMGVGLSTARDEVDADPVLHGALAYWDVKRRSHSDVDILERCMVRPR